MHEAARTRWRGVYRLEGLYVVPYEDHLGVERQREFADHREARQFRYAVKLTRDGKIEFGHPGSHYQPPLEGGDNIIR